MDVSIVTVGDELLSGDVENTNATWLARQLSERGVTVRRISVVRDDMDAIATQVARDSDASDAVVVTGGLGGTPDDITIDAVAAAFDRDLTLNQEALTHVSRTLEEIEAERPDLDLDLDLEAEATLPVGARLLHNEPGISPGCVVENVYVLPGIPSEMKAMFEQVADEFGGDVRTRDTRTPIPESNIADLLQEVRDEYGVAVGCYPDPDGGDKRIRLTASADDALDAAYEHLTAELDARQAARE